MHIKLNKIIGIIFVLAFLSCAKEETLVAKRILNPKTIFNNTSGWVIANYTENDLDSTKLFSKYWTKFNEDPTCAERVISISHYMKYGQSGKYMIMRMAQQFDFGYHQIPFLQG